MLRVKKSEGGFSLPEVLVSITISTAVLGAAATLLVVALNASGRVTDRSSSTAAGRVALEQISQRLASQTCLYAFEYGVNSGAASSASRPGFLHASANKMVFLGDIGNSGGATGVTGSVGFRPQIRWIWFAPANSVLNTPTGASGTLTEGWRDATNAARPFNYLITPMTSFDGFAPTTSSGQVVPQPSATRGIVDQVTYAAGATRYFTYYDGAGVQITEPGSVGGVPTASLSSIASVKVAFRVLPKNTKNLSRVNEANATFYLKTTSDRCLGI